MKLIKSLKEINLQQDNFPVFFGDRWLEFETSNNCSAFLCFDEEYNAVIPFKVYKLKFLKKANYIYVPLNNVGNRLKANVEKSFIDKFHFFLKTEKICDVIFPPLHICNFKCVPRKAIYYEIGVLKVNIALTENDLKHKIDSENRRQIKKAKKQGVNVFYGIDYLSDFYLMLKQTAEKKNIIIDAFSFFENSAKIFGDNCIIGICKTNGIIEAGFFDVIDKDNAYSLYSGTAKKLSVKGAKKYLIWDEFSFLRKLGCKNYTFGGYRLFLNNMDSLYNVQKFKRSMGADIEIGYHFIKIINPLKYYLFMLALKIKSLIKGKDLGFINKSGLKIKKSK